jgi:hypothetical protein
MTGCSATGSEFTIWRHTALAFALAAAGSVTASLQALSNVLFSADGSGEFLYAASQPATTALAFGTLALEEVAAVELVAADVFAVVLDAGALLTELLAALLLLLLVVVELEFELPPQPARSAVASSAAQIGVSLRPMARQRVVGRWGHCQYHLGLILWRTLRRADGSMPATGAPFLRYGGNTPCVAIAHDGAAGPELVLDAGTGITQLTELLAGRPFDGSILLTHLHWDHVQGLPFCHAADHPDAHVSLALPAQEDGSDAESALRVRCPGSGGSRRSNPASTR